MPKLYAKQYMQPAFLICTMLLMVAGVGMSIAIEHFKLILKKEPLPLKKSLDLLDENALAPFKVVSKSKIEDPDMIKSLGTTDYLQWVLKDSDVDASDKISITEYSLFITYYDLPDRVPHVPEECFGGAGYQKLNSEDMIFEINEDSAKKKIPARHLVFAGTNFNYWNRDTKFSVLYLFNVNGIYTNSREKARVALNKNIFGKSSYFCKVEWYFLNPNTGMKIYPKKEQIIAASQKLLGVILPVLEKDYWPDWQEQ